MCAAGSAALSADLELNDGRSRCHRFTARALAARPRAGEMAPASSPLKISCCFSGHRAQLAAAEQLAPIIAGGFCLRHREQC
jgi:hypothetical protein